MLSRFGLRFLRTKCSRRPLLPRPVRPLASLVHTAKACGNFSSTNLSSTNLSATRLFTTSPLRLDDTASSEEETIDEVKTKILDHALDHVTDLGWSREAISRGAEDAGFAGVAEGMFPREGSDLALHLVKQSNQKLERYLQEHVTTSAEGGARTSEFVRDAIEFRLRMLIPCMARWPEAMTRLASPGVARESSAELCRMVDDVWFHAGDESTDVSWYTKRALLAKLYVSCQLVMVRDQSPDFQDTWNFLDRRLEDLAVLGSAARAVRQGAESLLAMTEFATTWARNAAGIPNRNR